MSLVFRMKKYIIGLFRNLLKKGVSKFALVDSKSIIDNRARINRGVRVVNSVIGRYSYIGIGTWVCETDMGDFCSIASSVNIGLGNHTMDYLSTSPIFTEVQNATGHSWTKTSAALPFKRVTIGNDVWIGYGALVVGGVKIGDGAVVGAGSVVTKDIPPYAIVAGVPAKVIRYRFSEETIHSILANPWWKKSDSELKKSIADFQVHLA